MKKLLLASALCALAAFQSGCMTGSASEAHVKFGIPGVFAVQHDSVADKATASTVRLGDSKTRVQILLFDWESSGKDIVINKPKDPKP